MKKYVDLNKFKESWKDESKRKKWIRNGVILIILILALPKIVPVFSDLISERFSEIENEVIEVDVAIASPGQLDNTINSTGTLRAISEIDLSTEVPGKIIELHINEGEEVEQGTLLVKINDNDLQADLNRIKSNIEVMEQSESRQRQLFERGGATQEEYDATLLQLNDLHAEQAAIEAQIERTEIIAPFDGVLGLKYVDEGSYITPTTRIATLRDLSSVQVDFSIPERYANGILTGSEIRFNVQGTDSLFTGHVFAIEPGVDPRTRTVNIRAISDNSDGLLRSGAFANIELILESYEDALMIPAISLIPDMGEYKVMLYDDGVVSERSVETGIRTSDKVQIVDGIEPDDKILINGLLQVRDGVNVTIRKLSNLE